ncbi:MAG: hypothetical protein HRT86_15155 [Ilumatobacteraceae bacterium]|nr:hypothetical protein [Ilumatobacteraceae bacterium]
MNEGNRKHIGFGAFAGIVVVYLLIIQGLGLLESLGSDVGYAEFPDIESTLRGITIPVALSVVFVVATSRGSAGGPASPPVGRRWRGGCGLSRASW